MGAGFWVLLGAGSCDLSLVAALIAMGLGLAGLVALVGLVVVDVRMLRALRARFGER